MNIEEKSDIRKLQICEAMLGLLVIFRKNKMKKAPLPKISLLVQIVGEILKHHYVPLTPDINPSKIGLNSKRYDIEANFSYPLCLSTGDR